jgi:hypothetical protein
MSTQTRTAHTRSRCDAAFYTRALSRSVWGMLTSTWGLRGACACIIPRPRNTSWNCPSKSLLVARPRRARRIFVF